MPIIVCDNIKCKFISKRKSSFINGENRKIMCHTCRKNVITIFSLYGAENEEQVYGYIPKECKSNTERN